MASQSGKLILVESQKMRFKIFYLFKLQIAFFLIVTILYYLLINYHWFPLIFITNKFNDFSQ